MLVMYRLSKCPIFEIMDCLRGSEGTESTVHYFQMSKIVAELLTCLNFYFELYFIVTGHKFLKVLILFQNICSKIYSL